MGRSELAAILDNQELHAQGEEQHSQEDGVGKEALEDVQFYKILLSALWRKKKQE